MKAALLPLVLTLIALGDTRTPDRVELTNGTKLEGRVVYSDAKGIVLRVGTRDREIAANEIASVEARSAHLRVVLDRWIKVDPADVRAVLELASDCMRTDLTEEGQLFALHVLTLDADNDEAHALLGHEKRSSVWSQRTKTGWEPFDKLLTARKEWNDAATFATTHFSLRTNLALREAVDTALDLECFYKAFVELFATEIRVYDVIEPMPAEIHATKRSFPEINGSRKAYFDDSSYTLYVNAEGGLDRTDVFHEATHEILYFTSVRTKASVGRIPAWLQEGLAEYMSSSMYGKPGRPRFSSEMLNLAHFETHASAKDPYSLNRLLNFDTQDFLASSKAELKYAESYTLTYFCLHGDNGKYRPRFFEFLRGAYKGQASSTNFKDAIGDRGKDFEREWTSFVKEIAGTKKK